VDSAVATGLSATISNPNRSTIVTFRATDTDELAQQQTATATVATHSFGMMVPLQFYTYYIAIVVGYFQIFCRMPNKIRDAKLLRALSSKAC
tara:strand:- start:217 stop:492 length:276 start_codon:yes stop_codon:yes gene_type:complete